MERQTEKVKQQKHSAALSFGHLQIISNINDKNQNSQKVQTECFQLRQDNAMHTLSPHLHFVSNNQTERELAEMKTTTTTKRNDLSCFTFLCKTSASLSLLLEKCKMCQTFAHCHALPCQDEEEQQMLSHLIF